ncbi:MAG TPA: DedA family protein [Candidatus Paceibacterota bacterium]
MFDIPLESIIVSLGYLGIFLLMIANGFISFPSSQILYIIVGYFISIGTLALVAASLVGALGNTIGNIILYEFSRRKGISYITQYKMFPQREVKKVEIAFRKKGAWFLFVGKLLPAIKVFVPIPAGLGKMNRTLYAVIIFVSSYIWSLIFIAIGYYFGKSSNVFGSYAVILMIVALVVVALFYKYINSEEIAREIEE